MLYSITRPFAKIALGTYFRKIYISNRENLPKDKPVLLVSNHPTAFIEPCILACWMPRKLSYLARGDLYLNNLLIRKVYDWYHMTPVFRLEDAGYQNLKNNYASFDRCFDAFRDKRVVMILAEGRTIHEKRLRPIMKGAARIVFGTFEKYGDLDLQIVPVGVNFSNSDSFRSIVMIDVGKPFPASDYFETYQKSPPRAITQVTREIGKRLKERVVHINDAADDDLVEQLLTMAENEARPKFPPTFSPDGTLLFREKAIADRVNALSGEEKNSLRQKVEIYQKKLVSFGTTDLGIVHRDMKKLPNWLFLILGFLPSMVGKIWNIPPIWLGNTIAKKIAPAIEFRAATAGVFASVLWLIWLAVQFSLVFVYGKKWWFAILAMMPVLGYFHMIYRELWRKFKVSLPAKKIPSETLGELLRMRGDPCGRPYQKSY